MSLGAGAERGEGGGGADSPVGANRIPVRGTLAGSAAAAVESHAVLFRSVLGSRDRLGFARNVAPWPFWCRRVFAVDCVLLREWPAAVGVQVARPKETSEL